MTSKIHKLALAAATLLLAACGGAALDAPVAETTRSAPQNINFERDRQAILAMTGDYAVTFDFRETVPLKSGYKPKDAYITHAQEIVRVIEDRGDFISLQHILLVGGDRKIPIKHWRQDWQFEPAGITRFVGGNGWENVSIAGTAAAGKWAQIVYQVDDGPRYAGLGSWRYDSGFAEWSSEPTWRPLPRRDATKRSDYHAIEAVNRHAITPDGWVHEQDNTKLILDGDNVQALVREVGVNTYVKAIGLQAETAIAYWQKTASFWQVVRATWAKLETGTPAFGLTVQGEPEEIYMQILGIADGLVDGTLTADEASQQATEIISDYTVTDLQPLKTRLSAQLQITDTGN